MDALQTIYVFAQLALALDDGVTELNSMNHVFAKLDAVGKMVEEKYARVEKRADEFLARSATFDGKIDKAFQPHEAALDAADDKLHQLETGLNRLSNAPLASSTESSPADPTKPVAE